MLDGHWGVPKGHIDENENEKETALREIKEEVGLDVVIDCGFRTIDTYSSADGIIKDVVYFVAYSKSTDTIMQIGNKQNSENNTIHKQLKTSKQVVFFTFLGCKTSFINNLLK